MSSRGNRRKFYDVRVGRKVGVFSTWEECKAVVNGINASEFHSFPTEREAMDYVRSRKMVRTVCYMNLAPSSFVPGRAMRAVIRVVQEGEPLARTHKCCLDTGSDINISIRHLSHDVRKIEKESISTCGDETAFVEEGTLVLLVSGAIRKVPTLVAVSPNHLPFGCDVLLGVPGVDDLDVRLNEHRAAKPKQLQCHVGLLSTSTKFLSTQSCRMRCSSKSASCWLNMQMCLRESRILSPNLSPRPRWN